MAAATQGGAALAANMKEGAKCLMYSKTLESPTSQPPMDARDLEKVPPMRSTWSARPKWWAVPRPPGPMTPRA
jgi:hypothetical protein